MTAGSQPRAERRAIDAERARQAADEAGYDLKNLLGNGGYGDVYLALDRGLDRFVAIKLLPADTEGDHAQSLAGAQAQAQLQHAHIVPVYYSLRRQGLYLMVMEYMDGGTLAVWDTPLEPETACAIGLAIADALSHVHERGLLHLDVKPDNLLFSRARNDGRLVLKLTDFGVSQRYGISAVIAGSPCGMTTYRAPEQLNRGELSPATDICATGLVLYELLAGRPAYDTDSPEPRSSDTTPTLAPYAPPELAAVVDRAIACAPTDRQPSARDFGLDLFQAASQAYGQDWLSHSGVVLSSHHHPNSAVPNTPGE